MYRALLVVRRFDRVVEEDHHPVALEVLERAAVLGDELAHRLVVRPQHTEDLLRLDGLGERREAAEVAEDDGDRAPVAIEELLSLVAGDELTDLGREVP